MANTAKTVDEQIDALDPTRKLRTKARLIAEKLGKRDYEDHQIYDRTTYRFNKAASPFKIEMEYLAGWIGESNMPKSRETITIFYKGKEVFNGSDGYPYVDIYIPGPWEKELDALYAKVATPQAAPPKKAAGPAKRTPAEVAAERQNKLKKAKPVTKLRLKP